MRSIRWLHASILLAVTAATTLASDKPQAARAKPERAELDQQFAEKLTGAALVGNFTVDGQAGDKPPKSERYEISRARKVEGDTWEITARIKYGETDLQVPIQLDVLWAGDTPVMSLTDLRIPLMEGSFTARVLFYGDRYVGTWQHGKAGGHMFGHVERAADQNGKAPVSGVVTLDGQPVVAAIEFVPADPKNKPVSGQTDETGRFELKLPPGELEVRIKSSDDGQARRAVPRKYSENSPLRIAVKSGKNEFNFDLTSR
ncbi:MAG TPA: hypothetical protein VML55_19615 [Planctomycetaceae bacterium]|nr:hypothetical protein [Planctomycetaceae bacterium]